MMDSKKDWKAEGDFYSLSEAEAIMADKKRYSAALKVGKSVVKEKQETIKGMKRVANKKMPMKKSPVKKSAPKRSMKRKK